MTINTNDLKLEINDMLTHQCLSYLQRYMLIKAYRSNSIDEMYRIIDLIEEGVGE